MDSSGDVVNVVESVELWLRKAAADAAMAAEGASWSPVSLSHMPTSSTKLETAFGDENVRPGPLPARKLAVEASLFDEGP